MHSIGIPRIVGPLSLRKVIGFPSEKFGAVA